MKVQPVRRAKTPGYPTRAEAARNPALLKPLPRRWNGVRALAVAASALTALNLTACSGGREASAVAPIFYHGEGTGALGCVVMTPPKFLGEQEALALIRAQAEEAGLHLTAAPDGDYAVDPRVHKEKADVSLGGRTYWRRCGNVVSLKVCDPEKKVAVAYVSQKEAVQQHSEDGENFGHSTVQSYRFRERAEEAAKDFRKQETPYTIGVFYEPGSGEDETLSPEENLCAQVKDFLDWLEGQGIL